MQGKIIREFLTHYKKGFKDLGYILDDAKTIVSLFKATYRKRTGMTAPNNASWRKQR